MKKEKNKSIKRQQGFIALVAMLVIAAVVLVVGISIALSAIGELSMGFGNNMSTESLAVAEACMDEGLMRLKRACEAGNCATYTGTGGTPLSIGGGSCTIVIDDLGGNVYTVTSESTLDDFIKTLEANVTAVGSSFTLNSWQEG